MRISGAVKLQGQGTKNKDSNFIKEGRRDKESRNQKVGTIRTKGTEGKKDKKVSSVEVENLTGTDKTQGKGRTGGPDTTLVEVLVSFPVTGLQLCRCQTLGLEHRVAMS